MEKTEYTGMEKTGDATYKPGSENAAIVTQPQSVAAQPTRAERPSAVLPIVLSCFVAWCCCPIIGVIAFICAVYAGTKEDHQEYRKKLTLSKKLSILGLIVGIVFIIISVIAGILKS